MHIENINITLNGDPSAITRALIEAMLHGPELSEPADQFATKAPEPVADKHISNVPRIGEAWTGQGGIYAGVSRGEDGTPDAHIVLLDVTPDEKLSWSDAVDWAEGWGNGARLPTRFESALLYANLKDKIEADDWYWTGTQCSDVGAFCQYFYYGNQYGYCKESEGRARAVRRLVL